jgi:o-succinylbenzoate synthase
VLVSVTDDQGRVGYGEAAPWPPSLDACLAAIEDCREPLAHGESLAECARVAVLPSAISAIDLALRDLEPSHTPVPPVEVNATIAAADRAGAAAAAAAAREAGFRCVKVKVGLGDDPGRLAAVRAAAGTSMAIRIDANGAWSVDEAVASLRALEPVGIELCEEPVNGLDELARVAAAVPIPIALDESAALPGALDRRVASAVCLKIASCGGITGVIEAAARARAVGYEVYVASMLDGPLGIVAALRACSVVRPDRPCGLATLSLFDGRPDVLPAVRGRIEVPDGVALRKGLLDWYR